MKEVILSGGDFGGELVQVRDGESIIKRENERGIWIYDLNLSKHPNQADFSGME